MNIICEFYRETDDGEVVYEIHAEKTPIVPAKRWGHPDTWYPSEGGDIEILEIRQVTGVYGPTMRGRPYVPIDSDEFSPRELDRIYEIISETAGEFDDEDPPGCGFAED